MKENNVASPKKSTGYSPDTTANLGFEAKLWVYGVPLAATLTSSGSSTSPIASLPKP